MCFPSSHPTSHTPTGERGRDGSNGDPGDRGAPGRDGSQGPSGPPGKCVICLGLTIMERLSDSLCLITSRYFMYIRAVIVNDLQSHSTLMETTMQIRCFAIVENIGQ